MSKLNILPIDPEKEALDLVETFKANDFQASARHAGYLIGWVRAGGRPPRNLCMIHVEIAMKVSQRRLESA